MIITIIITEPFIVNLQVFVLNKSMLFYVTTRENSIIILNRFTCLPHRVDKKKMRPAPLVYFTYYYFIK